jgi:hypothetical protein
VARDALDYRARVQSLRCGKRGRDELGGSVQDVKITPALVEFALEEWKQVTVACKRMGAHATALVIGHFADARAALVESLRRLSPISRTRYWR